MALNTMKCNYLIQLLFKEFDTTNLSKMQWSFGRCSAFRTTSRCGFYTCNVSHDCVQYAVWLCQCRSELAACNRHRSSLVSTDFCIDDWPL